MSASNPTLLVRIPAPPSQTNLTTSSNVAYEAGFDLDTANTSQSERDAIDLAVKEASSYVRSFTGRSFTLEKVQEYPYRSKRQKLALSRYPIVSITEFLQFQGNVPASRPGDPIPSDEGVPVVEYDPVATGNKKPREDEYILNKVNGSLYREQGWGETLKLDFYLSLRRETDTVGSRYKVDYWTGYLLPGLTKTATIPNPEFDSGALASDTNLETIPDPNYVLSGVSDSDLGIETTMEGETEEQRVARISLARQAFLDSVETFPSDLEYACRRIASLNLKRQGRDPTVTSRKIGDSQETYWPGASSSSGLPYEIESTLRRYSRIA